MIDRSTQVHPAKLLLVGFFFGFALFYEPVHVVQGQTVQQPGANLRRCETTSGTIAHR